jgi:WD40 repeat protein
MSEQEQPLPPTPLHLFRSHSSPVTALAWSDDNERIYSADSSGKVAVTSSRSLRAITIWNAHKESVLGVEEWDDLIITFVRFHLTMEVESYGIKAREG